MDLGVALSRQRHIVSLSRSRSAIRYNGLNQDIGAGLSSIRGSLYGKNYAFPLQHRGDESQNGTFSVP